VTECFVIYKCIKTTFITSIGIFFFLFILSLFHSCRLISFAFLFCFPQSSFSSHTSSLVSMVSLLYFFNFLLLHSPFNNFNYFLTLLPLIFLLHLVLHSMNVLWQSTSMNTCIFRFSPFFHPSVPLFCFLIFLFLPTYSLAFSFYSSFIFCLSPYKSHTLSLILLSQSPAPPLRCVSPGYILALVRLLLRAWYFLILLVGRSQSCKMICVVGPKSCGGGVQVPLRTPLTKTNREEGSLWSVIPGWQHSHVKYSHLLQGPSKKRGDIRDEIVDKSRVFSLILWHGAWKAE
jgi:hypothetical protein